MNSTFDEFIKLIRINIKVNEYGSFLTPGLLQRLLGIQCPVIMNV